MSTDDVGVGIGFICLLSLDRMMMTIVNSGGCVAIFFLMSVSGGGCHWSAVE